MWPRLSDTFGVQIKISATDNSLRVEPVGGDAPASSRTMSGLGAFGFLSQGDGTMALSGRQTFRLSDLRQWFPGFRDDLIDRAAAPLFFVPPKPAQEAAPVEPGAKPIESGDADRLTDDPTSGDPPKKVSPEKILDFGQKIGRAKKDLRGNGLDDAGDPSAPSGKSIAALWPYAARAARDAGVCAAVVLYIRAIRQSLAAAVRNSDDIGGPVYESAINLFAGRLSYDKVRTGPEMALALIDVYKDQRYTAFVDAVNMISWRSTSDYRKSLTFIHQRHWRNASTRQLQIYLAKKISDDNDDNISVVFPCSKFIDVLDRSYKNYNSGVERQAWIKMGLDKNPDAAPVNPLPVAPDRPHLASLRSEWLPDHDVTTADLADRFGFRAVEWGNWLPQGERQQVLNEAYGACEALSYATGLPPRMVSLNGSLAAAFGSRGSGHAAAHFEPDLMVINLTRIRGAGSLAHEYGHALDHWMADRRGFMSGGAGAGSHTELYAKMVNLMCTAKSTNAKRWLPGYVADNVARLSVWSASWNADNSAMRADLARKLLIATLHSGGIRLTDDAMKKIEAATGEREMSFAALDAMTNCALGAGRDASECYRELEDICKNANSKKTVRYLGNVSSLASWVKSIGDFAGARDSLDGRDWQKSASAIIQRHRASGLSSRHIDTEFFINAKALDAKRAKPYWSTSHEMFARTFESFVFDVLEKAELPCDYLVHGVEGERFANAGAYTANPYPSGDERAAISSEIGGTLSLLAERTAPEPAADIPVLPNLGVR